MKYVVVQLYLSGKNNKMFNSGDVVDEAQLSTPAWELVNRGAIKVFSEEKKTDKTIFNDQVENTEEESDPVFTFLRGEDEVKVFTSKDISKKEVMELLSEKEIPFDRSKKESVLFDLLVESFK